jgi:hypothetical protein
MVLRCLPEQALHLLLLRHICDVLRACAAFRTYLVHERLEFRLICRDIVDYDVEPVVCESERDGSADTLSCEPMKVSKTPVATSRGLTAASDEGNSLAR